MKYEPPKRFSMPQAIDLFILQVRCVKRLVFNKLPPYLLVQLKRFSWDWERDTPIKSNEYFEFPLDCIDLYPYTSEGIARIDEGLPLEEGGFFLNLLQRKIMHLRRCNRILSLLNHLQTSAKSTVYVAWLCIPVRQREVITTRSFDRTTMTNGINSTIPRSLPTLPTKRTWGRNGTPIFSK